MKVLFVNSYDDPAISGGGAEVTLQHLTQGLLSKGVEPVMLSTSNQSGLKLSRHKGVRVWQAGIRNCYWNLEKQRPHPLKRVIWHIFDSYNVAMRSSLCQVLEAEKPDVVSLHNLSGWSAALWSSIAASGIPMVQVLHDMYLICPKSTMYTTKHGNCANQCAACSMFRLPHRAASNNLSAVVGVSRFVLDRHLEQGYFQRVPIRRVIYNARDASALGVGGISKALPKNELRIGYIGRLDPSKGIEVLLQAFVRAKIADAELWIAGSGSDEYVSELRNLWSANNVRFLGRVSQAEFYPHVDIVVVPSLWQEPLGMVVAEAFAFGRPVIAARRGGIPEMLREGENGLLFDPECPDDLIIALRRLSADGALRTRMGAEAVKSAEPFLNREGWVDNYLRLYSEISS